MKIQDCLQQKVYKQYSTSVERIGTNQDRNTTKYAMFAITAVSKRRNIHEEILIFDHIGLLASLGGSLGLFVGFSIFGYATPFIAFLIDKLVNLYQQYRNISSL